MRKLKTNRPEEQRRFEAFLRSRQLKLTGERLELVEEVFGQPHHFDADQLHMTLKQKGKAISRATVYRTLDLLVQCGLVRKSSFGDQHAHYEAVRSDEHHDHLICLNCEAIIEFFRPELEALQEQIPMGRLGASEDVAQAVIFLVSSGANYITGHVLSVNGGMYM